ncbi:MAG: hypothetical protein ACI4TK_08540 [Agathobacter sp.]
MKKRIISTCVICIMLIGIGIFAKADAEFNYNEAGERAAIALELIEDSTESNVIYDNGQIVITDADLKKKILGLQMAGKNTQTFSEEQTIMEQAFKDLVTAKTLVAVAEAAGYTVSDAEYEAYKNDIMDALTVAENKEEMIEFYDSMGGLEYYFEVMESTVRDSMVIRKYLDDLMVEYAEENNKDIYSIDFLNEWNEVEESMKESIYKDLHISSQEMADAVSRVDREVVNK